MIRDAIGPQEVMLAANVVASSRDAFAAHILGHPGFRIDPVTARLDPGSGWIQGKNGLKRGYRILGNSYGLDLDIDILASVHWSGIPVETRARFVANVLAFQQGHLLKETRELLRLFSIGELNEVDLGIRPGALLAPYLVVQGEESLRDLLALWQVCPAQLDSLAVEAVVALDPSVLAADDILDLVATEILSSRFSTVWLWVPGFRPRVSSSFARRLIAYRELVHALATQKTVKLLHSTYVEMLLSYDGVDEAAFSPHLGVAESTLAQGGLAIGVYYSPVAHGHLAYYRAEEILDGCSTRADLASELCPCELCGTLFEQGRREFTRVLLNGTPIPTKHGVESKVVRPSATSAQLNRFHNLLARKLEIDEIRTYSRTDLAARLASSAHRLLIREDRLLHSLGTAFERDIA